MLENVLPMLKDECTVNGGIYGFPIDAQVKACFYNKKMFEEAGVEVPQTKDDFFKVCDTFMEREFIQWFILITLSMVYSMNWIPTLPVWQQQLAMQMYG